MVKDEAVEELENSLYAVGTEFKRTIPNTRDIAEAIANGDLDKELKAIGLIRCGCYHGCNSYEQKEEGK